ncbi:hypothetical protein ACFVZH_06880 [Streptomyces sp. NPDC059534]|uniref:hypothetical protein n=1 Tax=Streptomyces sp. NPDC059534 TaxID=3346859 RepID=UPI00367F4BF4
MSTKEVPEEPAGPEDPKGPESEGISPAAGGDAAGRRGPRRRGLAVAAALLLACGAAAAALAYGTSGPDGGPAPRHGAPAGAAAPVDVTYEVLGEGTADISYRGPGADGTAVVTGAPLPWRKTVSVPAGAAPAVRVTLGEKGGTASCTLAVHGRHVQRATATGAFGRTTCGGEVPARDATAAAPEGPAGTAPDAPDTAPDATAAAGNGS